MTNSPTDPPAGWYPDPTAAASGTLRWWNGTGWSTEVRAAKALTPAAPTAPVVPALTPPPAPSAAAAAPSAPSAPSAPAAPSAPPYAAPYGAPAGATPGPAPAAYPGAAPTAYPGAYPGAAPAVYPGAAPATLGAYPGAAAPMGAYPGGPAGTAPGAAPGYGGYPGVHGQPMVGPGEPKSFGGAISSVFKQYVGFPGRASRSEFWFFTLFTVLISTAFCVIAGMFAATMSGLPAGQMSAYGVVAGLSYLVLMGVSLGLFLPGLAVTVRRLRDAGQHWAWIFISVVPLGGIVLIILLCQPSKPWLLPRN